jgi:hypothetical protein
MTEMIILIGIAIIGALIALIVACAVVQFSR